MPIILQAENLFRDRLNKLLEDYKAFDPEKYVKDIIAWYAISNLKLLLLFKL